MKNKIILLIVVALTIFSCSKEKEELPDFIKKDTGSVWISGGLYFCAEQIRLDEGDTLIVLNREKIYEFKSGDKVQVTYTETDKNESGCNIGKECEIIEIEKTN